jgi:3-dehydroquinate dehydratase-2
MGRKKVLVINGPNLNMLGKRDEKNYGSKTLKDIYKMMKSVRGFSLKFFQSNSEGKIITRIQKNDYDALIINPGAYTHTSIAIRDALEIVKSYKIEVHLSDVDNREDFRKINYIRDVCNYTITNKREEGYVLALKHLQKVFNMV